MKRLENGTNGRGPGGRFVKGCKPGPGNPHAKAVHQLRAAIHKTLKPDDVKRVIQKMLEMALAGDVAAMRELLDRCIGKAIPTPKEQPEQMSINVTVGAMTPEETAEIRRQSSAKFIEQRRNEE